MALNLIQHKIKLTTLSPLHIGNGEQLTSTGEYLKTPSHVHFLRHDDLMQRLMTEGHFQDYVERILAHERGFDFYQTLIGWGISPVEYAKRTIRLNQHDLSPISNNILQLHIKTNEKAYIPGSSIKGMLRTAIIFNYLKCQPDVLLAIEQDLSAILKLANPLQALKLYWEDWEMGWTGMNNLRKENGLIPHKIFHVIRPYDTMTVSDEELVVEQVNRQSFLPQVSETSKGLDWLMECIREGVELPFELTLLSDNVPANFQYLVADSPIDFFKCLNDHTLLLIQQERQLIIESRAEPNVKKAILEQLQHYESLIAEADGNYAICRMGKGKTIFFQTILPLLNAGTRTAILGLLKKKNTGKTNPEALPDELREFPRSRVLTVQDRQMMGWVKIAAKTWEKMPAIQVPVPDAFGITRKPVPKKVERKPTPENQVESDIKLGVPLKAVVTGPKKVEFHLNNQLWTDVQLVLLHKHQEIIEGEIVHVIINQVSKDGRIIQVKIR